MYARVTSETYASQCTLQAVSGGLIRSKQSYHMARMSLNLSWSEALRWHKSYIIETSLKLVTTATHDSTLANDRM